MQESVKIGNDCLTDTLTVQAVSTFKCDVDMQENVTIGSECLTDTLTVNAATNINCQTIINAGDCGNEADFTNAGLIVDGDAEFRCDVGILGKLYYCEGGTLEWPCPPATSCELSVLVWDSATLDWQDAHWETVGICVDGVTVAKSFLVKNC
jgi:hypothetical protein